MSGRKLPIAQDVYDQGQMQILIDNIDQRLNDNERAAGKSRYAITEPSGGRVRVFDPNTATLSDVADVLATLLADLKERGRIG